MTKTKKQNPNSEVPPAPPATTSEPQITPPLPKIDGFDMSIYLAKPSNIPIASKRLLINIPVKKPGDQVFFRIHPTEEVQVWILHWADDGERYIVNPDMLPILGEQAKLNILYLGMMLNGNPFFFPIQQKDNKGKWNSWYQSAFAIITLAKKEWIRCEAERAVNGYTPYKAEQKHPEPIWPEENMGELLAIAFRDRRIDTEDHPIIKSLRGK